jgi:hypothetical protein
MLPYWFKLICTDNCIIKCLYEDMFESSVVKPMIDKTGHVEYGIFFLNMVFIISGYLSMVC